MTGVRRIAVVALCLGLTVGTVGLLNSDLDIPRAIGGLGDAVDKAADKAADKAPGKGGTSQAASPVPGLAERTARLAAARDLLSARAEAVRTRDKSSWMATVDSQGTAASTFRGRQSVMFDNLLKLSLGHFSYDHVRLAPALDPTRTRQVGAGAWAATVTGSYSLAGAGRAAQSFEAGQPFEATYTLVHRPGGWRIADDADGVTPFQMWDLPGLRVVHGRSVVVVGNAPQARMREYSTIAESAVGRVTGVWGSDWSSHVVFVTPATDEEFARLLSRPADSGLDQVAAITQGVLEAGQRAKGDRVVVNPRTFTALQPVGRRVVVTHELTHVAARSSTTSPVPIWLAEGLAEYIGYSGTDLTRERVASELLTNVRAGKGPTELPSEVDFDPTALTSIAPSYSGSWLAVSRLVDLYGQARVVAFYRRVASATADGEAVRPDPDVVAARAFPRSFGVSEAEFVGGWRRYLRTLAHAGE